MDKKKKEIAIVIAAVVGVVSVIGFGFDSKHATIDSCDSVVTKWVEADFSETTTSICWDMEDGSAYTCTETDYWSIDASIRSEVISANGKLIRGDSAGLSKFGNHVPDMPPYDSSIARMSNFDRFSEHTHAVFTVYITDREGVEDEFTSEFEHYRSCTDLLGKETEIKTWYGITFNSNFG